MEEPDVTADPRYRRAELHMLVAIYETAQHTWPSAVDRIPAASLEAVDLVREPALGLVALRMPARHWRVAMGRFRPTRWYDVVGRIRFGAAVRRAKREIGTAVDRQLRFDARPR